MDADELKRRRNAAGLTQAQLGLKLGIHRDFIALMERGLQPVTEPTARLMTALADEISARDAPAAPPRGGDARLPPSLEQALRRAGIHHETDRDGIRLPDHEVTIALGRVPGDGPTPGEANLIVVRGEAAIRFLASAIAAIPPERGTPD